MDDDCKLKLAALPRGVGEPPRLPRRKEDAAILLASVVVLAVAMFLRPDPGGTAVSPQLWPTCNFKRLTGLPCGTCGMTRAFVWAVRGELERAWRAQPFGLMLFVLMLVVMTDSAVGLICGQSLRQRLTSQQWRWTLRTLGIAFVVAWAYAVAGVWAAWQF